MDNILAFAPGLAPARPGAGIDCQLTGDFTARSGLAFRVRPVSIEDKPALSAFFGRLTPEDLRYRFLTAIREVSHERLTEMIAVDHDWTENFVALDVEGGEIIASAMLAADAKRERGEVAIAIRSDLKRQGIGTLLMGHVCRYAEYLDITCLESIASRDNCALIELERRLGFTSRAVQGDPGLLLLQRKLG